MAGDIDKEDRSMFRQMLIVDAIRGHHSTGVASATTKKGEILVFKKALNPIDFMQLRGFDQVVDWSSQVLMGHNRYATVGKINHAGAHPFEHNGMVGAHNGTLERWFALPRSADFDVDSECLLWNISEFGFEETMKKVYGAYALVVYDDNAHELHLLRNKERPLYFGYKDDRSVMYWASEPWMIRNMAARCGIKLCKNIQQPKEHQLLTWKLPNVKNGKMPEPIYKKLEAPAAKQIIAPVTYNQGRPYTTAPARQGGQTGASSPRRVYAAGNNLIPGVSVGDNIAFCPVQISKAASSQVQYIEGIMTKDPWSEVRVYSAAPALMKTLVEGERVVIGNITAIAPGLVAKDDPYIIMSSAFLKQTSESSNIVGDVEFKTLETALNVVLTKKQTAEAETVAYIEKARKEAHDADNRVVMEIFYPGPGGKMITSARWNDLTKHGCGYCTAAINDAEDVKWVGDSPVCSDCEDHNIH
jgi:hypothetical protein